LVPGGIEIIICTWSSINWPPSPLSYNSQGGLATARRRVPHTVRNCCSRPKVSHYPFMRPLYIRRASRFELIQTTRAFSSRRVGKP
jgi:hypothetical protein